jgi:hypothetical protein
MKILRKKKLIVTTVSSKYRQNIMFQTRVGQACSQGGVRGFSATTINLEAPNSNLQSCKDTHADQPAKKTRDTLPHTRVASVELPSFETTHFQNCMNMPDVVCIVKESIM